MTSLLKCAAIAGAIVLAAQGLASTANAQGAGWSGPYIGISGGFVSGDASHRSDLLPAPPPPVRIDDGSYGLSGGLLGASAGYNLGFGQTVLGIEVDYSGVWADGDANCSGNRCGGEMRSFGTLRGRLGFDLGHGHHHHGHHFSGLLAYVTGGLAFADYKAFTNNGPGYSGDDWRTGWTIGAGLEKKLSHAMSLKVEYLYADFGSKDQFTIAGHTPERIDLTANVVRVGVNFKLGH